MRLSVAVLIVLATAAAAQSQQATQLDLCIIDTVAFAKEVKNLVAEKQWANISRLSHLIARLSALLGNCKPLFEASSPATGLAGTKVCGDAMRKCFVEMEKKSDFRFPPGTRTFNLRALVEMWKNLNIDVSEVLEHCQYALWKRI